PSRIGALPHRNKPKNRQPGANLAFFLSEWLQAKDEHPEKEVKGRVKKCPCPCRPGATRAGLERLLRDPSLNAEFGDYREPVIGKEALQLLQSLGPGPGLSGHLEEPLQVVQVRLNQLGAAVFAVAGVDL